ncbi:MAG: helix-turn-helix domain-containing protein [Solirubrobacterales bacterium]
MASASGEEGVQALLRAILAERREIAERVTARIRNEMPSFAAVPLEEHVAWIEAAIAMIMNARLDDPDPTVGSSAALLREIGERRARQGIPVEDLLRSWRFSIEEVTGRVRALGEQSGTRSDEVIDLIQQGLELADEAMISVASGHRLDPAQGEIEVIRRAALVRGALLGKLSIEELQSGFAALGLDPLGSYRAFRARARGHDDEDIAKLDGALALKPNQFTRVGLAALVESEIAGFSSEEPARGALPLIAIGPAVPAAELPSSYLAAGRVLAAAELFGLAGVHDLTTAGLRAAVISDAELADALTARYVEPVLAVAAGREILAAVSAWLAVGMRAEPAGERLFVHPNTIRYRLKRYQELTGADLAETEDAFCVWWALQREEVGHDGDAAARLLDQ